ncbi:MAG: L,D-transpeptidase [Oscillospiraceae bacterium]|nr:L,D-transpeptidase [Oscillospiraceae bacterium]
MKKKLIIGIILLVLLVSLSASAVYLRTHPRFPADTTICDTDVSRQFAWSAAPKIRETLDAYTVTVDIGTAQHTFTSRDLNLTLNEDALEQQAADMELGGTAVDYSALISMDITPVQEWINANITENRTEPTAAHLEWNAETCLFELVGGAVGEYNDVNLALQIVTDGIHNLDTSVTLTEADYHVEYTYQEQIAREQKALEYANTLVSRELTYNFYLRTGEYAAEVITPSMIGSWLIVDGEDKLSVTWDESAIYSYAEGIAETYTISGEDYFHAHDGRKIDLTVELPTNIIEANTLSNAILSSLENMASGEQPVPYTEENKFRNYSGTYIEISIGEQKLFAYKDGELFIETDVVTGCAHCAHDTKKGVFSVKNHFTNVYLQDKAEYFVYYWMGFLIPKYGMHDADGWREPEEYGGETYKTDGSGGCVNVPREIMAQLYETFEDGTPVIIYDDSYVITEDTVSNE